MSWGALANAATTGLAAAAYGAAALAAQRRQRSLGGSRSTAPLLFAAITVYLAIAALRQVAAWRSTADPGWVEVDRALYLAVLVPAALVIVPHVHLVSLVRWGSPRRSLAIACAFLATISFGLVFAYAEGIEGPETSAWGTDWEMRSLVTKVLLLVAIMLPGLVGSLALVAMARHLEADGRRRVRLIGWSCFVYFAVFTADAFGLSGVPLLAARLATAATGILAWLAYQPLSQGAEYSPPRQGPDDWIYAPGESER